MAFAHDVPSARNTSLWLFAWLAQSSGCASNVTALEMAIPSKIDPLPAPFTPYPTTLFSPYLTTYHSVILFIY